MRARRSVWLALPDGGTRTLEVPGVSPAAVLDGIVTGRAGMHSTVYLVFRRDETKRELRYMYAGTFTASGLPTCSGCGMRGADRTLYVRDQDAQQGFTAMTRRLCERCYLAAAEGA